MAEAAFRQHFYQREHWNFFTEEPDIGPCLLSFKLEHDPERYRWRVCVCVCVRACVCAYICTCLYMAHIGACFWW